MRMQKGNFVIFLMCQSHVSTCYIQYGQIGAAANLVPNNHMKYQNQLSVAFQLNSICIKHNLVFIKSM